MNLGALLKRGHAINLHRKSYAGCLERVTPEDIEAFKLAVKRKGVDGLTCREYAERTGVTYYYACALAAHLPRPAFRTMWTPTRNKHRDNWFCVQESRYWTAKHFEKKP